MFDLRTILKQKMCEHNFEVVDSSFDHEFGTEVIVYEECTECEIQQSYEPYEFYEQEYD